MTKAKLIELILAAAAALIAAARSVVKFISNIGKMQTKPEFGAA